MAPKPKLSPEQIEDMRRRKAADPSILNAVFADEYGVDSSTISRALAEKPAAAAALPADTAILLSHDALEPSPLNPRKTFDQVALEEFADNLADRGVLQNLLVRERPNGAGYWITAGERRWRAIQILVSQGRWDATARNIPCRVITGDDAQHRITAIIENLQRQDVPVLEEAQAFVDLHESDPAQWTAPVIAKLIGKTKRYVYQRMALATKLSDTVKEYLAKDVISIEAARMLCGQDEEVQLDVLRNLEEYTYISAADVRFELSNVFIPVSRAIFNVDELNEATGDIAIHVDEDGEQFFESRSQFWALQTAAMEARAAQAIHPDFPGGPFAWSKISTFDTRRAGTTIYVTDEACARSKCGVVIFADHLGNVEERLYQVERPSYDHRGQELPPGANPPPPEVEDVEGEGMPHDDDGADDHQPAEPPPSKPRMEDSKPAPDAAAGKPVTKSHIYHCHRRKTVALRDAMAANWETAMRLTVFSLLCQNNGALLITGGRAAHDDHIDLTAKHTAAIAGKMGKIKLGEPHERGGKKTQAILAHVLSLPLVDLRQLFAAVTAQFIHTPAGFNADMGDSPTVLAIAAHMKLQGDEEDQGLAVIREDLNGVRKQTLLAMADEAGTPAVNDSMPPGEIANAIAKKSKNYVLPTLRFASTAEIEKALKFK